MPKEVKYDLCIIGGGPAGYAAAMRAVDLKKRVVLIERGKIGGAGIYNGALSSKTMWELSTQIANSQKRLDKISTDQNKTNLNFDFEELKTTVAEAVFERKFQLQCHINLLQSDVYNQFFKYERGTARLLNKNEIAVKKQKKDKIIYAKNIIIATGSRPRKLDHIEVDEKTIFTSDGVGSLKEFPKSMVILGAGVIGCEFATIFSNFGKTKVYLIDKADRILPFEDEDIANMVTDNLQNNGVVVHKNSSLTRMEIKNGEVEYELEYKDGKKEVINVEKALLSVGRIPNLENLGLDKVGIKYQLGCTIDDDDTSTSIKNIYAIGDVTAHIALVNVAELEGRRAVEKMFGKSNQKITYKNISTIMFLNPEVAAVGMGEQQAIQKGISYRLVKLDYSCIARAIAMRKTKGFFKILVTDDDEMHVLGMRAVGEHASSAIQAVALLISMNKGIKELADLIHPHPSIIEGIQECLRMLLGKSVFKAEVFEDKLKCYRCVNGEKTPLRNLG